MGNSKLANGCQVTARYSPAPRDAEGMLSRVPGQYVAEASLTLPEPEPGQRAEVEIEAGHVGRVRLFFEVKTARRGKHSHRFWAAYRAEPVAGAWDSDTSQT